MERTEGTPRPPLSAERDADCSQKADDSPETEEEELKKEGEESLHKDQGGQTSVSEKQKTADEKCSEELDQDELPRKELSSFPNLPPKSASTFPFTRLKSRVEYIVLECSTEEESKGHATHNILPYQGPLDLSHFSSPTSNLNTVQSPYIPSQKLSLVEIKPSPPSLKQCVVSTHLVDRSGETITPAEGLVGMLLQSAKRIPNVTADTDSDWRKETATGASSSFHYPDEFILREHKKRFSSTTAAATPGHSQDDTWGTELYATAGPSTFPPSSPYFAAMEKHYHPYSTSSLSQIPSAKNRTLTQAENLSDMPLDLSWKRIPLMTADTSDSDSDTSERSKMKSAVKHKRKSKSHSSRRKKKSKKSSPGVASTADSSDYTLDRPPPGPLRETGLIETPSTAADASPGHSQDNTRETELHATAGPSSPQYFSPLDDSLSDSDISLKVRWSCSPDAYTTESGENRSEIMSVQSENASGAESDAQLEMETSLTDVKSSVTNTWPTESAGPFDLQQPDYRVPCLVDFSDLYLDINPLDEFFLSWSSAVHTAESGENINDKPQPSECESAGDSDARVKMEAPVTAVKSSVTNTQPTRPPLQLSSDPGRSQRGSSCLPRSHSVPSLSQISSAENKTFRPSESLPDLLLKSSFEEFTPDITVDEKDETYRFLCSCPGLYQCSVTGLVFHMEGEGDVVYRIVSWDRRLLAQHHKKPAGPLFDITCLQQSVCRLHLPHCEIRSTAGCGFLSVAHVKDESIEFIPPHKITETHVIINITGFSGFGNVKDEDSPPEPVQALVLLFYRSPDDQDLESLLNVLILPGNAVLQNVRRTRKSLVGDELYIETSSHCKLLPKQEYTLSTCPEDDSVLVQPTTAEFDCDNYDNYIPSFQVDLEKILKHIKLFLRDTNRHSVWERRVCLSSAGLKKSCGQSALNLPPNKRLFEVRSSFIEGISGPVLKSLLDKLFEKKVLTDSERESADEMQNKRDKARFVIDTVRRKGDAASSEMIEFLCELDPFLCEHLGLL